MVANSTKNEIDAFKLLSNKEGIVVHAPVQKDIVDIMSLLFVLTEREERNQGLHNIISIILVLRDILVHDRNNCTHGVLIGPSEKRIFEELVRKTTRVTNIQDPSK